MSIQAVAWAIDQCVPDPAWKLVLVALANHADHVTGECFLKIGTIAKEASISRRSVHRYLPELVKLKLVRVENRFQGKARLPSSYWLACGTGYANLSVPPKSRSHALWIGTRSDDSGGTTKNHSLNQNPPKSPNGHPSAKQEGKRASERPATRPNYAFTSSAFSNRGTFESQIAGRIGPEGYDVLASLPDWRLNALCHSEREGKLRDEQIVELRATFRASNRGGPISAAEVDARERS
jgi:hypothetical protein